MAIGSRKSAARERGRPGQAAMARLRWTVERRCHQVVTLGGFNTAS